MRGRRFSSGLLALLFSIIVATLASATQHGATINSISVSLFASLERLARLVDVAYCIGTAGTGISKPFQCISRCSGFSTMSLIATWNTGVLMSDSCGYIAVDHGGGSTDDKSAGPAIYVAFRGTYSIANTIVDLSTVPQKYVPYPYPGHDGDELPEEPEHKCTDCTVHMGFLESWKNTRKQVMPQLRQLRVQHPSYPVHLIGHSLGGAVACLAALELKVSLGWDKVIVTSFGEPRLGNYGLARFVDEVFDLDDQKDPEEKNYRRVTHKEDPVPLLPLDEWGYRPHAGEIYIAKQDLSPSEDDVFTCVGDTDPECSSRTDEGLWQKMKHFLPSADASAAVQTFPTRLKLWQILFAHRDYFWRLGLCVPGGDPANWGRERQGNREAGEL